MKNKNTKIILLIIFIIFSIILTTYLNSKQVSIFSKANYTPQKLNINEEVSQIDNKQDLEKTFKEIDNIDIDQIDKSLEENLKELDNL